ncbi:MAG: hypothetical protein H6739_39675 [Alphaproteobacteria bacterium]|nr:hypothetical protein [Alphaproteobacteria bacterium]
MPDHRFVDWSQYGNNSIEVMINELCSSLDAQRVEDSYRFLEKLAIPDGELQAVAVPVAIVGILNLVDVAETGLPKLLDLLFEITAVQDDDPDVTPEYLELVQRVRGEVARGYPFYMYYLDKGDLDSQRTCIDLLGLCGYLDLSLAHRICFALRRHIVLSQDPFSKKLVSVWLEDLESLQNTEGV